MRRVGNVTALGFERIPNQADEVTRGRRKSLWYSVNLEPWGVEWAQFRWSRDHKRGSVVARLLGARIRIPLGTWMSVVSVVCCQRSLRRADHPSRGFLLSVCVYVCVCVCVCVIEFDRILT